MNIQNNMNNSEFNGLANERSAGWISPGQFIERAGHERTLRPFRSYGVQMAWNAVGSATKTVNCSLSTHSMWLYSSNNTL